MRVGIEVGGTFTDLVAVEGESVRTAKVPSTPANPDEGAMRAIDAAGLDPGAIEELVHGSTVATNAVLERKGAAVCLFVTKGIRDVLLLQRHDKDAIYDLRYAKPEPVVRRRDVIEIDERIAADGTVVKGPDRAAVTSLVRRVLAEGSYEAAALCFLHAYANPDHERMVAGVIREVAPSLPVTCSNDVTREFREYERASTTVLAAYVQPVMAGYVSRFSAALGRRGFAGRFSIMQSNGGRMPAEAMARNAISALFSGPAAGVIGAVRSVAGAGYHDLITLDMGGTSTDVSLVADGDPELASMTRIDGLPVKTPVVDIVTVGAGGGSIAWADDGGLLRVGPGSAGATPGPACYRRGGDRPTVTDAHLVRGTLRPDAFLGGRMEVDRDAARRVFRPLAGRFGVSVEEIADSVIRLAEVSIVRAIQRVSTERGRDPRDYVLVPFGGAGPCTRREWPKTSGSRPSSCLRMRGSSPPPDSSSPTMFTIEPGPGGWPSRKPTWRTSARRSRCCRRRRATTLPGSGSRRRRTSIGYSRCGISVRHSRSRCRSPTWTSRRCGPRTSPPGSAKRTAGYSSSRSRTAPRSRWCPFGWGSRLPHRRCPQCVARGQPGGANDEAHGLHRTRRNPRCRSGDPLETWARSAAGGPLLIDDGSATVYVPPGWTAERDPGRQRGPAEGDTTRERFPGGPGRDHPGPRRGRRRDGAQADPLRPFPGGSRSPGLLRRDPRPRRKGRQPGRSHPDPARLGDPHLPRLPRTPSARDPGRRGLPDQQRPLRRRAAPARHIPVLADLPGRGPGRDHRDGRPSHRSRRRRARPQSGCRRRARGRHHVSAEPLFGRPGLERRPLRTPGSRQRAHAGGDDRRPQRPVRRECGRRRAAQGAVPQVRDGGASSRPWTRCSRTRNGACGPPSRRRPMAPGAARRGSTTMATGEDPGADSRGA